MDKETVDTIIKLNDDQNKHFKELINAKEKNDCLRFKGMQQSMDAGFNTLATEMKKINGSVHQNSQDITDVKNQTTWWRFFQRNPRKTAATLAILVIGSFVIMGFDVDGQKIMEFIKTLKFW